MSAEMPVHRGFSLIELLLVLALTGILLTVALPGWQHQVQKSRRFLAIAALQELQLRQTRYFMHYRRYASSLEALGYQAETLVLDRDGQLTERDAEGGIYRLSMSSSKPDGYRLVARVSGPQASDRRCQHLSLDASGLRGAGPGEVRQCW